MVDGIPGHIQCVVFDFADTLCSDHYFSPLGEAHERAISKLIFGENSSQWADPWMVGKISATEIATYLAGHLPLSASAILAGLHEGCRSLRFNPAVWELVLAQRRRGRKTALVTGNMEVFTEVVVPSHRLDQVFDAIVNSSDYGEGRKEVLWPIAFAQLGPDYTYANGLLIEDSLGNVERFRALGGVAHRYTSDRALLRWLSAMQSGTSR
jgi:FMN phosphatase YigB (HAD superfamily)